VTIDEFIKQARMEYEHHDDDDMYEYELCHTCHESQEYGGCARSMITRVCPKIIDAYRRSEDG